jgi:hypothetical protein
MKDGVLATVKTPLTLDDPEAVTAEAFHRGVFQSIPWDDALREIRRATAKQASA